jgi:hypothetical protein
VAAAMLILGLSLFLTQIVDFAPEPRLLLVQHANE